MPRPYYGFSCLESSDQLQDIVRHARGRTDRRLMLGTHMSSRSLRGLSVERPRRTLSLDQVRGIYSIKHKAYDEENLFPVIHFNSEGPNVIDSEMLHIDKFIHDLGDGREVATLGRIFKGFQINGALPSPDHLRWFQSKYPWPDRCEIILQLGSRALQKAKHDPEKLAVIAASYKGAVDYVLLDASGGRGQVFNPEWARPYLRVIADACPWVGIGIAGGLGPDTLGLVVPLRDEFPNLSIDAESRIRDDSDGFAVKKSLTYLDRAINIFEKHRHRRLD